jgi:hypothetical protein
MANIIDNKDIIDNLENILDYKYQQNNNVNKTTYMLYDLLIKADKYVKRKKKGPCFNYKLTKINMISQIPKPEMYDSSFFPDEIQKHIDDNSEHVLQFTCEIKKRTINVYMVVCENLDTDLVLRLSRYMYLIYMWIYMLHTLSMKDCSKTLDLYLYLTPFTKVLPDNQLTTLDAKHVNTGFTTGGCREKTEIVLYRSEEWFKVFIHETFHCFGLDFSDMNLSNVNSKLKNIFNMNIEYNVYESYCEVWARIINTMFYTYMSIPLKEKDNQSMFINLFNINMDREATHSLYQCLKILTFMDLKYDIVIDKNKNNITSCNHLYRENTNVFSYYIISGLLMNNYKNFMNWCYKNNNMLVKFKKTPSNLDKYIELIEKSARHIYINKNISKIEKGFRSGKLPIIPTMRMTVLDVMDGFFL